MKLEIFCKHKCLLGEGPVWNAQSQSIYWIDILKGEIHQFDFKKNLHQTYPINEMIGCFAFCKNGQLIMATQSGISFLDHDTGQVLKVINPENNLTNNRFNDGKCDPMGRFWAGTMSLSEEPNVGSLYVFDNKTIEKKIENVTISNGLAWSLDQKTMYYIDTPTFEVVAFDYEKETGNISKKKIALKIPEEDGYPDGMTIDTEGCLWIAHWGGWQVTRWNPKTGEKILSIKLPVSQVTSCTFGGENLSDLFITSASVGLSAEALAQQPLAGSFFVVKNCGFKGVEAFEFG
jgi:sugar lactone lactonase YvrE